MSACHHQDRIENEQNSVARRCFSRHCIEWFRLREIRIAGDDATRTRTRTRAQ